MASGYSKKDIFRDRLFALDIYESVVSNEILKNAGITANEPNNFDLIEIILPLENNRMLISPSILDCTKICVRCDVNQKKSLEIFGYKEYSKSLNEDENSTQNILKEIMCVFLILKK